MWCTTCRQIHVLHGSPLNLTGWRGLWIERMGSVWAEEAAERCLTWKGAGGENLQRPEDVEAQAKGWKKEYLHPMVPLFVQKHQGQRQQGGFEELEGGAPGGAGLGLERKVWAEGWGLLGEVDARGAVGSDLGANIGHTGAVNQSVCKAQLPHPQRGIKNIYLIKL